MATANSQSAFRLVAVAKRKIPKGTSGLTKWTTKFLLAKVDAGGTVCFPNQGRVTLQSDRVAFQINRVNFRWGLEDQTAPQTSGGEEEGG